MINLTKENIDKAITNKALNIVNLYQKGFIFTNETICTFNSIFIFRGLFNNRCKMLDSALEKLYYIADSLIPCIQDQGHDYDDGGGDSGSQDTTKYYTVTVISNPSTARVTINGITGKEASFPQNTRVTIIAKLDGYYDKTVTISALTKNENVQVAFTDADKIPTQNTFTVTIGQPVPVNAKIYVNDTLYNPGDKLTVNAGTSINIRATADGYNDYTNTFVVNSDVTVSPVLTQGVTFYNVTVGTPTPANAVIKINGVVKNVGDVITVESGTPIVVTAEAEGYNYYSENITINRNTTISPVLTAIPATTYTYKVIVRVDGTEINDATIVLTNQNTSQSVAGNQITVSPNTSVGVVISKTGYQTRSFTKIITGNTIDTIDLIAEDNNVYIQVYGHCDTDDITVKERVKVYVNHWSGPEDWEEIQNDTPYRIIPGDSYRFYVCPVDGNGNRDLSAYQDNDYHYSSSQTRNMRGTTVKEIVCNSISGYWRNALKVAVDENDEEILNNISYLDEGKTTSYPEPKTYTPFGETYQWYKNSIIYGRDVAVVADGYKGHYFDMYNPTHQNPLTIIPKLDSASGNFLKVQPAGQGNTEIGELYDYSNSILDANNPYENDMTLALKVNGYRTTDGTPVINAILFIDCFGNYGKGAKNVNDIGTPGSINGSTPIAITFDNQIAEVGATALRGDNKWTGAYIYPIIFNVNEDNYVANQQIVATITDGNLTRTVTFILPNVPRYDNTLKIVDANTDAVLTDDNIVRILNGRTETRLSQPFVFDSDSHIAIIGNGYKGQYLDEITNRIVELEPSNSFLIVQPTLLSEGQPGTEQIDNIVYTDNNVPYENPFTIYPKSNGYWNMDHSRWIIDIQLRIFVDSNLNWLKNARDINNESISSSGYNNPTPLQVTFNNSIAKLVTQGTTIVNGVTYNLVGPNFFHIKLDIDENNYVAGQQIIATVTDGVLTRQFTIVVPTISEYEN